MGFGKSPIPEAQPGATGADALLGMLVCFMMMLACVALVNFGMSVLNKRNAHHPAAAALLRDATENVLEYVAFLERRVKELEKGGVGKPVKEKPKIARAPVEDKALKSAAHSAGPVKTAAQKLDFTSADPSRWTFKKVIYTGAARYVSVGKEETVDGVIAEGIRRLRAEPSKYFAIKYQSDMMEWPEDEQTYRLIHREGTKGYKPQNVSPEGWMTLMSAEYQRLPPVADLGAVADSFTEAMMYQGYKLHHSKNRPLCPGRGVGVGDVPSLKIIGDIDPSDVSQGVVRGRASTRRGPIPMAPAAPCCAPCALLLTWWRAGRRTRPQVGDCWLLSAISALAEFDGAVERLFRKTADLNAAPRDGPNTYTVTLWDLPTWSEVDVVIDERLAAKADGSGLLGCSPSADGELWVCYLEKAIAVHCGGWDAIDGGQCPHAWMMLTGCKEQCVPTLRRPAPPPLPPRLAAAPHRQRPSCCRQTRTRTIDAVHPRRRAHAGTPSAPTPRATTRASASTTRTTSATRRSPTRRTAASAGCGRWRGPRWAAAATSISSSRWRSSSSACARGTTATSSSPRVSATAADGRRWPPMAADGRRWPSDAPDAPLSRPSAPPGLAGTKAGSDTQKTDGIVDGHAYSVLECHNDVAGTDIDLIKMRNPWGSGEIDNGRFDDDGPGWDEYPQIKAAINPVAADDGIFYMTKEEFFTYFHTIYVCASNMTQFLKDDDAPAATGEA